MNNAPFSIGQKVVRTGKNVETVKKGGIYTVSKVCECGCGRWRIAIVEDKREYGDMWECEKCGSPTGSVAYLAEFFAPVETNYADATAEILEKFPVEDGGRTETIKIPKTETA